MASTRRRSRLNRGLARAGRGPGRIAPGEQRVDVLCDAPHIRTLPGDCKRSFGAASVVSSRVRVLTWNLFHGRSLPPAGRDLMDRFAALLAEWDWDVALLQETPPWWPEQLARVTEAEQRTALTSRNAGLAVRRALGRRWPDAIKSNAGGSNAILVRARAFERHGVSAIEQYHAMRLRQWPERRVAQVMRLKEGVCVAEDACVGEGVCVANYHGSARRRLAEEELEQLGRHALAFADGAPLVVGGDLNLRSPALPAGDRERGCDGAHHVARRDVDHILAWGMEPASAPELLDRWAQVDGVRVQLSDHVPLRAELMGRRHRRGPPERG